MARVTASNLLKPQGDLDADVILTGMTTPDVKVQLDRWIAEAYAQLLSSGIEDTVEKSNAAATAYVAYKAYYNKYIHMMADPLHTWVEGEARDQYDLNQVREFKRIAESNLVLYAEIVTGILQVSDGSTKSSFRMVNEFTY